MIRKLISFLLLIIVISQCYAQVKAYPIDSWHSNVSFKTKFGGLLPVKGSFDKFYGTVMLDESDLSKTSTTVIVSTESINTGVNLRDNHLRSEDFFDVEKFPNLIFSSTGASLEGGIWNMTGNLVMHGVEKDVSIPFVLVHGEKADPWKNFRITLQGNFELNRLDFGIGVAENTISETVEVELVISARIFNTETIALFNRPFGERMVAALSESIEKGRQTLNALREQNDKDYKASSFEFLNLHFNQYNNTEAAMNALVLMVEAFSENASGHALLAEALWKVGRFEEAKQRATQALELDEYETLAKELLKLVK